jgi:ABC-type uncharacterized transport system permease subunit
MERRKLMQNRMNRQFFDRLIDSFLPFFAVLGAFIVGAVILLPQDVNPLEVYQAIINDVGIGCFIL